MSVHSSLEAVGFIAAVSTRLAAHGIGVNPVAAYFHDHLFVPSARATEALALLESFAR
nr:ACT domain-containing protein [Pyxidicoccus fallax]